MNPLAEIYPAAVQAWITQGSTQAAAGGTQTRCPGYTDGTLHTGLCFFDSSANADSGAAIDGSLLPGPAVLTIELRDYFGVRHTWQGDITLVGGT